MKNIFTFFILLFLFSCQKENYVIIPTNYLSVSEQEDFIYSVSRYINKLPSKATNKTKFDSIFDEEYKDAAKKNELLFYYFDKENDEIYFAITKIAPSLKLKRVATVGKLKKNKNGEIINYEEEFRTYFFDILKEQKLTSEMQKKIIDEVEITPEEVRNFFKTIPVADLPVFGAEMEVAQIVVKPVIAEEEKKRIKAALPNCAVYF